MATGYTVPAAMLQQECKHHQLKGSTAQQALLPLSLQEHVCPGEHGAPLTPEGCAAAAAASELTPDVPPSPKRARIDGNSIAAQPAGHACMIPQQHLQQHNQQQQQEQVVQLQPLDDEAAWLAAATAAAAASVAASETRSASDPGSASLLSTAALPAAAAAAGWAQMLPDLTAAAVAQHAGQAVADAAAAAASPAEVAPQLPAVQAPHASAEIAAAAATAAAEAAADIHSPPQGEYVLGSSNGGGCYPQSPAAAGLVAKRWDAALPSPATAAAAAEAAAAVRAAEAADGCEIDTDMDDADGSSSCSMDEDEDYTSSSEDGAEPQSPAALAAAGAAAAAAAPAAAAEAWDAPMQDADGSMSDEGEEMEEGEEGDSEYEEGEEDESEYESEEEGEGAGAPTSSAGVSLPQPPAAAAAAEPWQPAAAGGAAEEGGALSDSASEGSEGEEEEGEEEEGEEPWEDEEGEGVSAGEHQWEEGVQEEGEGVSPPAPGTTAAAAAGAAGVQSKVQYKQHAEDGGDEAAAMFAAAHTAALGVLSWEDGAGGQQDSGDVLQQQQQQQQQGGIDSALQQEGAVSEEEGEGEVPVLSPGTVLSLDLLRSVQPSKETPAADGSNFLMIGTAAATVQQLLSRGNEGSTDVYLCRVQDTTGVEGYEVPQPDSEYLVLKVWNAAGAAQLGLTQEELQEAAWDLSVREAWVLSCMQNRNQRESRFLSCFAFARVAGVAGVRPQYVASSSSAGKQGAAPSSCTDTSSSSGGEFVGLPCLLLYWCEGGSLEQRLEPSPGLHVPLSARETWRVVRDVHTALCQAHDATIMLGRLSARGVLVRQGCGYEGGNGYCLCSMGAAVRQTGGRAKKNSAVYDQGLEWGAPDEHYGQHSETWKLGLLFLACRTGLASSPPNGRCFDDVATAVMKRVPPAIVFTKAELELMNACFADESVRQAPCDLQACSYFTEAAFHQLSVVSPPCWIGKVESTC